MTHGETTMATARRAQRGVSLLEALLATSIAGVLTSAAVPAMSDTLARQRLSAGASELFATFNLARAEAIRRTGAVAVVPADENDWSTGWRAFVDANDNGVQDAGEETILSRPPTAAGLSVHPHFGATFSGKVLTYNAEGRLHRPGKEGLVIGRLVITHNGLARSLCFASLGVRIHAAATCE
jgi:type IV fimbrial biogenesis protein FimT